MAHENQEVFVWPEEAPSPEHYLGSPVGPLCATRVRRLSRCRSQGRGPPRGEKELLRGGSDIPWGLPCTRLNTGCSRLSRAWWASSEGCEGTGSLCTQVGAHLQPTVAGGGSKTGAECGKL